ncbi:hypothetical protein Ddye_028877 [Dipteronia dyeriana]|uniref:Uncharacterized protein n=1 Tax=Dipteronia dyeriana TaxID=168575 RepID=A0AAD9TDC9_9ROSI|nr:hypothetical protein Ddye_028877 [Dipteronia dyeriana]
MFLLLKISVLIFKSQLLRLASPAVHYSSPVVRCCLKSIPQQSFYLFCFDDQLLKKQINCQENILSSLSESVARTSLLALVSASLFFVDPALAYKD